ncbi:MAG: FAD/NAD(P)-binding oxidoreductase [Thermodesulfobacteriota bacterium]|nr:FAD/NAD(P)-binding oxidoreductase [Thermodesulfobacteriota bacterium]
MNKTVLVLGGGWGGLAVAYRLRGQLGAEHRVVVIEKNDKFSLGPVNLWVMTGDRKYPDDVERPLSALVRKDIEWLQAEVTGIDPVNKTVQTTAGTLNGDYIVIALGSESYPEGVPGFVGNAYNLFDAAGAARLHDALQQFKGGKIVIFVSNTPFRCPPAPYEAALLIESMMRRRGMGDLTEIHLYTPESQPMPVAGPEIGAMLRQMVEGRGIKYHPNEKVMRIDGSSKKIIFEGDKESNYDLLIGVPPHRAPRAVVGAGLTDSSGYIPTHPQNLRVLANVEELETRLPGVYVVGDSASITLFNLKPLPKAGVFAEEQAATVASNIASDIRGEEQRAVFDGKGVCYIEAGDGMAAEGSGNFYAYPNPRISINPPSPEGHKAKEEFEKLLTTWFA